MTKPTAQQFDRAITWLECNEGPDGEREDCKAVAQWLLDRARDDYIRKTARAAGLPVAAVRRKLAEGAR
jgi:hypothetical protein